MNAEIIAVGSELVNGQKLDTNSQWLSRRLGELGLDVRYHTSVGDDLQNNVDAFRIASGRARLVLISGGIGPTQDDLTREALARVAGVPLIEDPESLEALRAFFERRNRPMPDRNRVQALMPEGAEAIANPYGTAPGIWMPMDGTIFVALPGVPGELKRMFDEQVVPRLRSSGLIDRVIVHRVVNLFGKGESDIEAEALDLTVRGRRPEVGITASDATISFRISCECADEVSALAEIEPTLALIRERFGPWIVGEGTTDVTEALVEALLAKKATLAVAESCTGGLIAQRLTAIPGVSDCFLGGVVSYANSAKQQLLGVPEALLKTVGAVSPEVAEAMASGVRERFGATLGLSVTGIAGPGGGSEEKPVGLVYLGLATPSGVSHRRLLLGPDQPREVIRSRSAKNAMNWARQVLLSS
jgi:nicotinamide-nucleotide amidase